MACLQESPRDIFTLWCSPTAEHVAQPVVVRKGNTEIRTLPPMLALQVTHPAGIDAMHVARFHDSH